MHPHHAALRAGIMHPRITPTMLCGATGNDTTRRGHDASGPTMPHTGRLRALRGHLQLPDRSTATPPAFAEPSTAKLSSPTPQDADFVRHTAAPRFEPGSVEGLAYLDREGEPT